MQSANAAPVGLRKLAAYTAQSLHRLGPASVKDGGRLLALQMVPGSGDTNMHVLRLRVIERVTSQQEYLLLPVCYFEGYSTYKSYTMYATQRPRLLLEETPSTNAVDTKASGVQARGQALLMTGDHGQKRATVQATSREHNFMRRTVRSSPVPDEQSSAAAFRILPLAHKTREHLLDVRCGRDVFRQLGGPPQVHLSLHFGFVPCKHLAEEPEAPAFQGARERKHSPMLAPHSATFRWPTLRLCPNPLARRGCNGAPRSPPLAQRLVGHTIGCTGVPSQVRRPPRAGWRLPMCTPPAACSTSTATQAGCHAKARQE